MSLLCNCLTYLKLNIASFNILYLFEIDNLNKIKMTVSIVYHILPTKIVLQHLITFSQGQPAIINLYFQNPYGMWLPFFVLAATTHCQKPFIRLWKTQNLFLQLSGLGFIGLLFRFFLLRIIG